MAKRPLPAPAPFVALAFSLLLAACNPGVNPLVIERGGDFYAVTKPRNPFVVVEKRDELQFTPDQDRNFKVLRAMAIEDEDFREYLLKVWTTDATTSTGLDLATLGLTAASSLTVAALAKALAATATAVTGARTAIDKNFFYGKTVDALLYSMVSTRAAIRTHIQSCLRLPSSQYDLPTALYDVVQYREAGRLQTAIANIAITSNGSLGAAWQSCATEPPVAPPPRPSPARPAVRVSEGFAGTDAARLLSGWVLDANAATTVRGQRALCLLDVARTDPRFQQTQSMADVITQTGPAADDRRSFILHQLRAPPPNLPASCPQPLQPP